MLLKDCPVGSMVRLVDLNGLTVFDEASGFSHWNKVLKVLNDGGGNYVVDGNGSERRDIYDIRNYQFALVGPMTVKLGGVTYNLTPVVRRQTITIDGIEYEMEEVK